MTGEHGRRRAVRPVKWSEEPAKMIEARARDIAVNGVESPAPADDWDELVFPPVESTAVQTWLDEERNDPQNAPVTPESASTRRRVALVFAFLGLFGLACKTAWEFGHSTAPVFNGLELVGILLVMAAVFIFLDLEYRGTKAADDGHAVELTVNDMRASAGLPKLDDDV